MDHANRLHNTIDNRAACRSPQTVGETALPRFSSVLELS